MLAVSSNNGYFCSDIDYSQHEKEQCYYGFVSNLYQWGKSDEIKTEYCNEFEAPAKNTCLALKARDISMCGDNPNCLTHFEQPLSFCDEVSDRVSCTKIFLSPWGKLFGVSNVYIGMVFYAAMIWFGLSDQVQLTFLGAVGACIASLFLAYILFAKIKTFCLVCITTYAINVILLVLAYRNL